MSEMVPSSSGLPEEAKTETDPALLSDAPAAQVETELAERNASAEATKPEKLASERVIINAPMSFAGSAQRAFRLRAETTGIARVAATIGVLLLTLVWWAAVVVWYFIFGILLVPYRLLRRGARKRKAEALRHRELLSALDKQDT